MPRVGFEPTVPASARMKTVHPLDCSGLHCLINYIRRVFILFCAHPVMGRLSKNIHFLLLESASYLVFELHSYS
jgi:hypothetical protein